MKLTNRKLFWLAILVVIYGILAVVSWNNCYFWDTIQQISNEAHWFYWSDFRSVFITPDTIQGISATGYHPPLMGLMTATLWKLLGCRLWVSHLFILMWAVVLLVNVWKLSRHFVDAKYRGIVTAIVMLEATVLTQFSIASPDFILFAAFVVSVRAVLENKRVLLAVGIFFLCCINMRGVFAGVILLVAHSYYAFLNAEKPFDIRQWVRIALPYLPTFGLLALYFSIYLMQFGWFIDHSQPGHYSLPSSFGRMVKHAAEFGVRLLENGRILLWLAGGYLLFKAARTRQLSDAKIRFVLTALTLLMGLYVLFIFITQMPFGSRYFMPPFLLMTLLVALLATRMKGSRPYILFGAILLLELTGHFWIYPHKIAKQWDGTLAHLSYYELRKACFNYIDSAKLDYNTVAGGFCLYGDRRITELTDKKQRVSPDAAGCSYFIHSNISNNEDAFVDELRAGANWQAMKHFQKGFVYITIYRRTTDE